MKNILPILVAGLACISPVIAADPVRSPVTLTVKKQVLDSEHDQRGMRGSSKQKTLTLRVEISNTSSKAIDDAEISGNALVMRAGDFRQVLLKESLGTLKVPAMKPNARLTLDLGKIEVKELELAKRKFEESLEEWQIVCTSGGKEIAKAMSSEKYTALEKDAKSPNSRKAEKTAKKLRNL
jgi:hypothetical protein